MNFNTCKLRISTYLWIISFITGGVVPASAPAWGSTVIQAQTAAGSGSFRPDAYELRAYTMRPLYSPKGEAVNWQHGLRGKVAWSLSSYWSAGAFSDMRFYQAVEEETDQIRFPIDLELGLNWRALSPNDTRRFGLTVVQTAVLPVDRNRQRAESFQGAYRIGPQLTWDLPDWLWAAPTLHGGSAVQKNLHIYEEKINGDPNTSWEGSVFAGLVLRPQHMVSLKILGERLWAHQYGGRTSDVYAISNEVSFALTNQFELGFGHSNKSNVMAADQRTANVTLVSEDRSLVYGMVSYVSSPQRSYP